MSDAKVRYFEFKEGTSAKFWEIQLQAKTFRVRYGRLGSVGRTSEKTFGSEAEAKDAANKLMLAKHAKGYQFISADREFSDASATDHDDGECAAILDRLLGGIEGSNWAKVAFGPTAKQAEIQRAEKLLGASLPPGYLALVTERGPFSVCDVEEDDFGDGYYQMLPLAEAIEFNRSERATWEELSENAAAVSRMQRVFFFQAGFHKDHWFGFEAVAGTCKVVRFDHDDAFDQGIEYASFGEYLDATVSRILK